MANAGVFAGVTLGLFILGSASSQPPSDPGRAVPPVPPAPLQQPFRPANPIAAPATANAMREGTELVDQPGAFMLAGDRLVFVSVASKRRLIGLENLNLERISRTIADNPESVNWMISGTVTEYRGANYVFVRRAILKSRPATVGSPPPAGVPAVR
jgi:hypothetical protein